MDLEKDPSRAQPRCVAAAKDSSEKMNITGALLVKFSEKFTQLEKEQLAAQASC